MELLGMLTMFIIVTVIFVGHKEYNNYW